MFQQLHEACDGTTAWAPIDGLKRSIPLRSRTRVNVVGGFSVDVAQRDSIASNRPFAGVNIDLGTYAEAWDFNLFLLEQRIDGIIDRRAVGGEARYARDGRNVLGLVDYDISYGELNIALLTGNLTLADRTTLHFMADYRNSPSLATSNALVGQTAGSVDALVNTYGEDTVRTLVRDRTARSASVTAGVTRPVNEHLQLAGDLTAANVGATPASGGVEAVPGTGTEYYATGQLIGSDLVKTGDTAIIGARYSAAGTGDGVSLFLNSRYPLNERWRLNPRVRLDLRRFEPTDERQTTLAPALRVEFLRSKQLRFEVDGGLEWSSHELTEQTERTTAYFFFGGFRTDF